MKRPHQLSRTQLVGRPLQDVFAFFADASNLEPLTPRFLHFRILTPMPMSCAPAHGSITSCLCSASPSGGAPASRTGNPGSASSTSRNRGPTRSRAARVRGAGGLHAGARCRRLRRAARPPRQRRASALRPAHRRPNLRLPARCDRTPADSGESSVTTRTIVWFRGKDLRSRITRRFGTRSRGEVVPLFVLDPYFFAPKRARELPHRMQFLLDSLRALEARARRARLAADRRRGQEQEVVPRLVAHGKPIASSPNAGSSRSPRARPARTRSPRRQVRALRRRDVAAARHAAHGSRKARTRCSLRLPARFARRQDRQRPCRRRAACRRCRKTFAPA